MQGTGYCLLDKKIVQLDGILSQESKHILFVAQANRTECDCGAYEVHLELALGMADLESPLILLLGFDPTLLDC